MAYTIVRTDNLSGIVDGSKLATARFYASDDLTAIENGAVIELKSIDSDAPDRFTWKAEAVSADKAADGNLILVATPENNYERKYFDLADFRNEAGDYLRGYVLEQGDVFSVTVDGFTSGATTAANVPSVGDKVAIETTGKLIKNANGKFAKCLKIETAGTKTFYVLRVL